LGQVAFDYKFSTDEMDTMSNALKIAFFEFGLTAGKSIFRQLSITSWMYVSHRNGVKASKEQQGLCGKILGQPPRPRGCQDEYGYTLDCQ
jgi:hypothetical protein